MGRKLPPKLLSNELGGAELGSLGAWKVETSNRQPAYTVAWD